MDNKISSLKSKKEKILRQLIYPVQARSHQHILLTNFYYSLNSAGKKKKGERTVHGRKKPTHSQHRQAHRPCVFPPALLTCSCTEPGCPHLSLLERRTDPERRAVPGHSTLSTALPSCRPPGASNGPTPAEIQHFSVCTGCPTLSAT